MIYCIEDDVNIRDLVVYALNAGGFQAVGFESSLPFWAKMKEEQPELILLDIMLPGEDGISILKKLRSSPLTVDIPVIMTTARGTEYDKVIGLDSGADDYLVKPFGMLEMVSRIKAVLRRTVKSEASSVLCAGPLIMDINRHLVQVNEQKITLTLKEFNILRLLLENRGRVFSRDQLLENVWGIDFAGETRTVDVHIGTLRTKLGTAGSLIQTVHGVGYKLDVSTPDHTQYKPQAQGSGPDHAQYKPQTQGSGPDHAQYKPQTQGSGPDHAQYKPQTQGSGPDHAQYKPQTQGSGPDHAQYKPQTQGSGPDHAQYKPQAGGAS